VKIVFLGSGPFGLPTLERLRDEHELTGVISQPDRPAGRRRQSAPTPVASWVQQHAPHAPLIRAANVNEPSVVVEVRALPADACVVIAFGQKLSPALLADRFVINLHASLLPRWRGAAPVNHAILAGDAETGNTIITVTDRIDAGLILAQSRRPIEPWMTAGDLHDALSTDGPDLVMRALADYQAGRLQPVEQDERLATRAPKLKKSDGWVDFTESADLCRRRVHGLTPWPGATVRIAGESVKLLRVQTLATNPEQQSDARPGALVDPDAGVVACGWGTALRLLEVQPAGKRPMRWPEFAQGRQLRTGQIIEENKPC